MRSLITIFCIWYNFKHYCKTWEKKRALTNRGKYLHGPHSGLYVEPELL